MKSENLIHYGIHTLELAYTVLGSGAESVQVYGKNGHVSINVQDWGYFYWNMLNTFVTSVQKAALPIPLDETFEIIKVLILGVESLRNEGKMISLNR
jgi:hypothetical protein